MVLRLFDIVNKKFRKVDGRKMFETVQKLMDRDGITLSVLSKETGVPLSTLSEWRAGKYLPKDDKRKKVAEYFGVSLTYLDTGVHPNVHDEDYYIDPEAAQIAQEIFDNPDLHALFDAARDVPPESLRLTAEMLKQFKKTNEDS